MEPFSLNPLTLSLAALVSVLSSLAGVGGGGMLIPLYFLSSEASLKHSVVLSIATISGSSVIRGLYYIGKKTHQNDPLINYEKLHHLIPYDSAFAVYGFALSKILPDWVILTLINIVLCAVLVRTATKTWKEWKKSMDKTPVSPCVHPRDYTEFKEHYGYLLMYLFLIGGQAILRPTLTTDESMGFWILSAVFTVLLLVSALPNLKERPLLGEEKTEINPGLPIAACFTGSLSTLLGIGGGMIINPILLHVGLKADVVAATGSFSTLFSSLVSTLQYISTTNSEDHPPFLNIIAVFSVGIGSAVIGLLLAERYFRKRLYYVMIALCIAILVSFILLVITALIDVD